MKLIRNTLITLLLVFTSVSPVNALTIHDVDILYWYEEIDGKHHYYYHVFNLSDTASIVGLTVGYDYDTGLAQLSRVRNDTNHIPSRKFSPSGWSGEIVYTEEAYEHQMHWRLFGESSERFNNAIAPSDDSYRFGVVLPTKNDEYLTTEISALFSDATYSSTALTMATAPPDIPPVMVPILDMLLSQGKKVYHARLEKTPS